MESIALLKFRNREYWFFKYSELPYTKQITSINIISSNFIDFVVSRESNIIAMKSIIVYSCSPIENK